MEQERLKYYQNRLLQKEKELHDSIKSMEEGGIHVSMKESIGELSLIDNHPADVGDVLFERSKDLALRDQSVIELRKVEGALTRIGNGSYGFCITCQKPIEEERLNAIPEAAQCLRCRRDFEGQGDRHPRPIEEDVIRPPFGEKRERAGVQFDGEDAWQAVARYGSSDTPSDLAEQFAEYPDVYVDWDEDRGTVEDVEGIPYIIDQEGIVSKDYSNGIRNNGDFQ